MAARLEAELRAARAALSRQEQELRSLRTRTELASERLDDLEHRMKTSADQATGQLDARFHELRSALEGRVERGAETVQGQIQRLERETRESTPPGLPDRIGSLEGVAEKVRAGDAALRALLDHAREERMQLFAILEDVQTRLSNAENRGAPNAAPGAYIAVSEDDLRRIKGIGPKYERALHGAGVHTFAQIAEWTPEDVERMAILLGTSVERIHKAGWMKMAGELVRPDSG